MDTSIRIEVPAELYNQLVRIQEKRRQAEGRKPSLSSIILEFCSASLKTEQPTAENVQNAAKNVQSVGNSEQNSAAHAQNSRVSQLEENMLKRLARWEESLSRWDSSLNLKESRLRNFESDLASQKEEIFSQKLELLDEKERNRKESLAGPEKIIENKLMELEMTNKDKKIKDLEAIINRLDKDYERAIRTSKQEKDKSSFQNIIKEYWPAIIAGAGVLITCLIQQKSASKKQTMQLEKLLDSLEKIDPGNKDELVKTLVEGVKGSEKKEVV